jgi:hypothetical protein
VPRAIGAPLPDKLFATRCWRGGSAPCSLLDLFMRLTWQVAPTGWCLYCASRVRDPVSRVWSPGLGCDFLRVPGVPYPQRSIGLVLFG